MNKLPFYRQALHEGLSDRIKKNPKYSLRSFARYLGIEASGLSQVLSGKRFLSLEKAEAILERLDLAPAQHERFKESIAAAKKEAGHERFTPGMKNILRDAQDGVMKQSDLSLDRFKVIADWYHYAILELTFTREFQSSPEWIAKRLGLSVSEVTVAIDRLLSLELLEVKKGRYRKTSFQLDTQDKHLTAPALRRRQKQILEKSIESLENDPFETRNHTAMTLAVDRKKIPEAKRRIQAFMNELTAYLETGTQTTTYEMVVNLFPLEKLTVKE